MSQRYKLTIEYDGRDYFGWQRQDDFPTIQDALETAAAKLDGAPKSVFKHVARYVARLMQDRLPIDTPQQTN